MAKKTALYRPLAGSGFQSGGRRLWQAVDHLLLIKVRVFRETYARVYWTDIQAALLYPLARPRGPMLVFEAFCLLAVAVSAPLTGVLRGSVLAALFLVSYASWRLTRPNWACQVSTRISTQRFPLANAFAASRRIFEDIKARAISAQSSAPGETIVHAHARFSAGQHTQEPARAKVAVYALAFALGLFAPLNEVILVIYYVALAALLFLRRDFEFPFAITAAAVMSQILGALQLVYWLASLRYPLAFVAGYQYQLRISWEFHILRVLFSLFGIAAIYQRSVEYSRYQPKGSTVLGLS
jgi:hypothetical protein